MPGWVLHVDLDQFIAAVEVLRRPELRGRPVVVGGDGDPTKRGVVSTASYEARRYGVGSGMALRIAARRCPDAVFLPVDREAYDAASAEVMAALRTLGVTVQVMGWDEAFLAVPADADPESVALLAQQRVLAATALHCTVGIGRNKLQAKIATNFGKPAGVFRLTDANWYELLGERRTDALWGIGPRLAARLAALGIHTVADLADADPAALSAEFGPQTGPYLLGMGRGEGSAEVSDDPWLARSRSRETTYQQDIADWSEVRAEVVRIAHQVAADLATEPRPIVRVAVKIRYAPFFTYTRSRVVRPPAAATDLPALEAAALEALDRLPDRRPVRLVGVRCDLTPPAAAQPELPELPASG
jgi:nucleotidyltransferase/DNA polymerase involved in DNA repair